MTGYDNQRAAMILSQVRANDVHDRAVIEALGVVPRERFVPAAKAHLSYADDCVEVKAGRHLLDPRTLSKLLQLAELKPADRVLDIASATGYSAAVLALMCAEVVTLEEDPDLAALAAKTLAALPKSGRITGIVGAHALGAPDHGPFDAIIVNGAIASMPEAWIKQLKLGGRIVAIIRKGPQGRAVLFVRDGDSAGGREAFDASVPHLPGFQPKRSFAF